MMATLHLEPSTRTWLLALRARDTRLSVFDLDRQVTEDALAAISEPLLRAGREPAPRLQQYRWFLRELAGVLREREGWDLAFELELLLRRWAGFGLNPRRMQLLVRAACKALVVPEENRDAPA